MKKQLFRILFLSLFIALVSGNTQQSLAQAGLVEPNENRTGSIYSYRALGTPIDLRAAGPGGMGLSGVAIYNAIVANAANPAIWSKTLFTQATGTLRLQRLMAEDTQGSTVNALLDAVNFQLVLPIDKNKLGASISLMPLTRKNYSYVGFGTISADQLNSVSDLVYLNDNKGEGGLNRFEIGFGYSLTNNISIGYAPSVTFGYFENSVATTFSNPIYRPLAYEFIERMWGITHRFGFYTFKNTPFFESDLFSFGANLELGTRMTAKDRIQATYSVIDGQDFQGNDVIRSRETDLAVEGRTGDGKARLPLKAEIGLLYQKTPSLSFSTEYLYQPWSTFEARGNLRDPLLQDRHRWAMGFKWLPALKARDPNFINQLQYRTGISTDSGYLNYNGTEIRSIAGHLGISIPARNSRSSVDIAFEYGIRGTTDNNLVQERYWTLKMSFNLAELMFFDRRFQ